MSTLYTEPIVIAGITQEIRLKYNSSLYALRVNLLKYGTPSGDLLIKIYADSDLVSTTTTAMSTLNDAVNNTYGYGMFRFDLDIPIKKTGTYTTYSIVISSTVDDENNYYGWNKDWKYTRTDLYGDSQTDGVADTPLVNPYMFELIEYN